MPITKENIETAIEMAKEFGAKKLLLFGSALDNPSEANDLDIGISGIQTSKFFLYAGKLEDKIRVNVDLVPLDQDSPFIEYIKRNGRYIYESQ